CGRHWPRSRARSLFDSLAQTLKTLVAAALEHPEQHTAENRRRLGVAARRVLMAGLRSDPVDNGLVVWGLKGVVRTFDTDPAESEALLRRLLDPMRVASYGHDEI